MAGIPSASPQGMEQILNEERISTIRDTRSRDSAQRIASASDAAAEAVYTGSTQVAIPLLYALAAMVAFGLLCVPVVLVLRIISEIKDFVESIVSKIQSIFSILQRFEDKDDDD